MRLRSLALTTLLSTYGLMLIGSYVKSLAARYACPDWPLCYGQLLPPFPTAAFSTEQVMAEWFHRLLAAGVVGLTVWMFVEIRRNYRRHQVLLNLGALALGLLLTQVVLGAATVNYTHPLISVAHLGMATAFFAVLVLLTTASWNAAAPVARRGGTRKPAEADGDEKPPRSAGAVVLDYMSILKPRILMLLLVAGFTSMLVAVGTDLDAGIVTATLVGGALAAGAGNAFNMVLERDIDALMTRTRNRPIPSGRVPASNVLAYGFSLALLSFVILATWATWLAAFLALGGALFYVIVYTLWLKRTRPNNIVIGGAAGSFSVLVAWAGVTNQITVPALILGFLIFLWTPPHFWAIALFRKTEYANAKIPMLPVVRGDSHTNQQIFFYTLATVICSTLLVLPWFGALLTPVYLLMAMILGAVFVWMAFRNLRDSTPETAYKLFRFSIMYLGLVFIAMAVDVVYIGTGVA